MQIQLQNLHHASGEDVSVFLRRAKLLADGLATAMVTVPTIGADYGEAVTALAIRQTTVTFDELMEVMSRHQIQLKMRNPAALINQIHSATPRLHSPVFSSNDGAVRTAYFKPPEIAGSRRNTFRW